MTLNKKPWSRPEVRTLPVTEELLARISRANGNHPLIDDLRDGLARGANDEAPAAAKRAK